MRARVILYFVSYVFCLLSVPATGHDVARIEVETYSITITITGIRNNKGAILIKFYDDKMRFPETDGFRIVRVPKSLIVGDSLIVTYHDFHSQYMGVSLLDDENDNLKLDFGFMFPKEGHAFSDYHHSAMRKPVYEDFRFLLTGNKNVVMKMKYY